MRRGRNSSRGFVEPLEKRFVLSTLANTGLYQPQKLEVFGGNVYFVDQVFSSIPSDETYMVDEVSASGGKVTTLVSGLASVGTYGVDSTGVYGDIGASDSDTIFTVPTGGTPKALGAIDGQLYGLLSNELYYLKASPYGLYSSPESTPSGTLVSSEFNPQAEVIDGDSMYFVDQTTQQVEVIDLTNGQITDLNPDFSVDAHTIFTDANNVYVQSDPGALYSVSKTTGNVTQLLANGGAKAVCSDGTEIYLIEGNTLEDMPVKGGTISTLATVNDLQEITSVAASGSFVYYTGSLVPSDVLPAGASGSIYRIPSPAPGKIDVTATLANGAAATDDLVELLSAGGIVLGKHDTSLSGTCSFTNLTAGSYNLEFFSNGDLRASESATVRANGTTKLSIQQNEPYAVSDRVEEIAKSRTIIVSSAVEGDTLAIIVDVKNATAASTKTKVSLELVYSSRNKVGLNTTSAVKRIAADGTGGYSFIFAPKVAGTFSAIFSVQTLIGSSYIDTDSGELRDIFTVTA
jgi:hypothetical protein